MLLPRFELVRPRTVAEAVAALASSPGAVLMAGGTDLVPAMKNGLIAPTRVVSLSRVAGLRDVVTHADGAVTLGAGLTLAQVAAHPALTGALRAVAVAASRAAGPQVRHVGTLGGNVCLPPRCAWYNQSRFWRAALGGCLRADGQDCRVVEGGKNCVAAMSADTPTALIALGATLTLAGKAGERTLPVEDLYQRDGMDHLARAFDEIVVSVTLPAPAPGSCSAYQRLATREAIDFPQVSVAVAGVLVDGVIRSLRIVASVLAVQPRILRRMDRYHGARLDEATLQLIGADAFLQCRPLPNIDDATEYRRQMVPVLVRRALAELA